MSVAPLALLLACTEYGASKVGKDHGPSTDVVAIVVETCDGLDDDGDGDVDEGSDDVDLDGTADCVDDTCMVDAPPAGIVSDTSTCEPAAGVLAAEPYDVEEVWRSGPTNGCRVTAVADLDGDGGADVICSAYHNEDRPSLYALRGRDGAMLWSAPGYATWSAPAVGDLDGDGRIEVVGYAHDGTLVARGHTGGVVWWTNELAVADPNRTFEPPLEIADLDGDGSAEVVTVRGVFHADGTFAYSLEEPDAVLGGDIVIADLDGDGANEILADHACHDGSTGAIRWRVFDDSEGVNTSLPVPLQADADPDAEVAWLDRYDVTLTDGDGTVLWVEALDDVNVSPGLPCAVDVDDDGVDEVLIASRTRLRALRADGSEAWAFGHEEDPTAGCTGCALFDFDADGAPEVLYSDAWFAYVLDRATGAPLLAMPRDSATAYDLPIVADLNGDGHAELLISFIPYDSSETDNLIVYRPTSGLWPAAPPIWGSQTWSGTSLWPDGEVRSEPSRTWEDPGFFRGQVSDLVGGRDLVVSIDDDCVSSCDDAVGTASFALRVANLGPQDLRAGSTLTVTTADGEVLQTVALDAIDAGWSVPIEVTVPIADARGGLVFSVDGDCETGDDSVSWTPTACP